jgi:hypothetical protein
VTRRRKTSLRSVWMLSKLTTQSVGTPSASALSSSSDTKPRRVRVSAATTTEPIRAATGSRVSTSTGRSPPGVAANQMSPRCIGPVRPILSRTPIGNRGENLLTSFQGMLDPGHGIVFAGQPQQMLTHCFAEQLRTVDAEPHSPCLDTLSILVGHTEAQHCHTLSIQRMTLLTARHAGLETRPAAAWSTPRRSAQLASR